MNSTFRNSFYAGCVLALLLGLWLARLWTAENQVRRHSENFLRQIEKRSPSGALEFVANDYHDDWGDDRALLLDQLRLVLHSFSRLTISSSDPRLQFDGPVATWSAKLHLEGEGSELVPEIISRSNSLATPYQLRWRHESWKPWDWKLTQVSNPSLELPAGGY